MTPAKLEFSHRLNRHRSVRIPSLYPCKNQSSLSRSFACVSLSRYTSFLCQPWFVFSILLQPHSFRAFQTSEWLANLLLPMASSPPLHRRPRHAIHSREASRLVITPCKILPLRDLSLPTHLLVLLKCSWWAFLSMALRRHGTLGESLYTAISRSARYILAKSPRNEWMLTYFSDQTRKHFNCGLYDEIRIDGRLGYQNMMCIGVGAIPIAGGEMAKSRGTLDPKESACVKVRVNMALKWRVHILEVFSHPHIHCPQDSLMELHQVRPIAFPHWYMTPRGKPRCLDGNRSI